MKLKYREDVLLEEFSRYVAETYGEHYVSPNGVQSLDLIFATGNGPGFCVGNCMKYLARYGKKRGLNRDDVLKVLHYALLLLYVHDEKEKV